MRWISLLWTAVLGPCWTARCYDLTAEDQDAIVERHNYFRSEVIPTAANMRMMSWDVSLADVAAGYAPKCVWEHNPDLKGTGENLYATNGPFNASKAVTSWYMEHQDYTYHNNSCEEEKLCGHYTQLVWAETSLVGCATHLCEEVMGLTLSHVTMLVCNYSPQGNYLGRLPYEEGEPCSNCPMDLEECEANICVEPTSEDEEMPEVPEPGTDSPAPGDPSTPEGPTEAAEGPTTEAGEGPTTGADEGPTTEAGEDTTPPEECEPLCETSSLPNIVRENGRRGEDKREWSRAGAMAVRSSALLLATVLLLTL